MEETAPSKRLVRGDGLALVIEIVSPGSEAMDLMTKVREYARAGIPQYWVIDRDGAQTVTLYQLSADGAYEEGEDAHDVAPADLAVGPRRLTTVAGAVHHRSRPTQ